jgi:putative restriction endonuclease
MMANRFDEIRSDESRALQVYLILIGAARNRQILTYNVLAEMLRFKGAGVFAGILGHVMFWCKDENLPALTSLVVNQDTGLPGDGLITPENANREREKVYQFDWYSVVPPTTQQLDASFVKGMTAIGKR